MFGISGSEWIFILLLVLILFGGKKIPELARSLGKGVSEFKKGVKELEAEATGSDEPQRAPAAPQPPVTEASNAQAFRFDPYSGKPVTPKFDPYTGKPLTEGAIKPAE